MTTDDRSMIGDRLMIDDRYIDDGYINEGRITEGAFAQDETLKEIVIPEGVTDIGEVAFYGCTGLKDVTFPDSLRFIREEAFGESGVLSVSVPSSMELIAEKAFFACEGLRRIDIPGPDTVIERDAFSCCPELVEGYVACGYPEDCRHHEELLYTLLWCGCPERHTAETSARAENFVRRYEDLVMDWVIRQDNRAAMSGIVRTGLLASENISRYIAAANEKGRTEITALLMSAAPGGDTGEFDL